MNEVNKTLYIPLYGKSLVSRQNIILHDPSAENIWETEGFPLSRKSKSKWLAYNMAMRSRVFDDWTDDMLAQNPNALVLHIGCGLDSRYKRILRPCACWIDCDFPDVISLRKRYFSESEWYHTKALNASDPEQVKTLPDASCAVVILEGLSMYLNDMQLHNLFMTLEDKYTNVHILMDVYTVFGAKASKFKNPINDVGVHTVYGIDDLPTLLKDLRLQIKEEHCFTPDRLIRELRLSEQVFFRLLFTGKLYRRIYRLFELETGTS